VRFRIGLAVVLLLFVLTPLSIGLGWFKGEAGLRSFNHVKETYQQGYDDVEAMKANASQACRLRPLAATNTQRQTQLLAIENNYDRIKAEYEAYMHDHFRGGVIRPGLPLPYPNINETSC
jgi:hypothetical protein